MRRVRHCSLPFLPSRSAALLSWLHTQTPNEPGFLVFTKASFIPETEGRFHDSGQRQEAVELTRLPASALPDDSYCDPHSRKEWGHPLGLIGLREIWVPVRVD